MSDETTDFLAGPAFEYVPKAQDGIADELTGERIGEFVVGRKIGFGGMGVVYEAEQSSPQRKVALKLIHPRILNKKSKQRFEIERELLGRLQHPGIAQIYHAGTAMTKSGERPFYAMELISGQQLFRYANENNLSVRERLELIVRVAEAIQHAHTKGVIHRDLKPDNILVDSSGQTKILDFGVARDLEISSQFTTCHSDIRQLIGTLSYMSPEQVAGIRNDIDTRTDVYSLGVIGYGLLTGRYPYDIFDKSIAQVSRIICEQDPTPLSAIHKYLRGDVETIFAKVLKKDPADRYSSASAFGGDIQRFLLNEPIEARPPTITYQLKMIIKKRRGLFSGLIVVLMLALSFLIISLRQNQSLAEERRLRLDTAARSLNAYNLYEEAADLIRRRVHHDRAMTLLDEAVMLDPSFSLGFFERAELQRRVLGTSDMKISASDLQSILDSYEAAHQASGDQGFPRALLAAGWLCRDYGELDRAIDYYNASAEAGVSDIYARVARAEVLTLQYRRDEALDLLIELSQEPMGSEMAEVWGSLGYVYLRKRFGEFEEKNPKYLPQSATKALRRAVELNPTNDKYWHGLGLALRDSGSSLDETNEALAAYRRAAGLAPDVARYHNSVAVVLRERGRYMEAIAAQKKCMQSGGLSGRIDSTYLDLAFCQRLVGDLVQSISSCKQHVQIVNKDIEGYEFLVDVLNETDAKDQAVMVATEATVALADDGRSWHLLGTELLAHSLFEEAEAAFQTGINVDHTVARNSIGISLVAHTRGNFSRMEAILRDAMLIYPMNYELRFELGKQFWRSGETEQAAILFNEAIGTSSKTMGQWIDLANRLSGIDAHSFALEAYNRAIEVLPNDRDGRVAMARFLLTCENHAIRDARLALDIIADHNILFGMNNYAEVADLHMLALLRNGRHKEALMSFTRAVTLHGRTPSVLIWASIACANLGDEISARMYYYETLNLLKQAQVKRQNRPWYIKFWAPFGDDLTEYIRESEGLLAAGMVNVMDE